MKWQLGAAAVGGTAVFFSARIDWRLAAAAAGAVVSVGGYLQYLSRRGRDTSPPDYSREDTWFQQEQDDSKSADCFYVHPTTEIGLVQWNIPFDQYGDRQVCNGMISGDPDLMLGHAGAFAECCTIWAPRYRQMGFLTQIWYDIPRADEQQLAELKNSMERALSDVKAAFAYFLQNRAHKDRPFVLAGHSQGAVLLTKVMADCLDNTEHMKHFVGAYLAGGYVPRDLFETGVFKEIHICDSPTDLQCVMSWDTRTERFHPESIHALGMGFGLWPNQLHWLLHDRYCELTAETDDVGKPRVQINPLTWSAEPGGHHLGVNMSYKNKIAGVTEPCVPPAGYGNGVRVTNMAVVVPDPEQWLTGAGNCGGEGNMHPIDVQFWFFNIRRNVKERVAAYLKSK